MSKSFRFELVTPLTTVMDGQVEEVQVPGLLGEFGVLPEHAHFLSLVRPGELRIKGEGVDQRFVIGRGVAEVNQTRVVVLTDEAVAVSSLNLATVRQELEQDESRLAGLSSTDPEAVLLTDRIERSRARLNALSPR